MQRLPGLTWLKVDIADANSALAREYKIQKVPFLQIYGPQGELVAEGDAAVHWIDAQIQPKP
jgi:hypothetical protein